MTEKLTLRDNAAVRWAALLLLALAMFCSYIFMDILSPIKDLMQSERGWDSLAFGTMQGSETFLNVFVFFLIFAGIILDKMGVRHMLLKGSVMKNFYPSPDMRTMGDIDILVDAARCDDVVKAFMADGFEFAGEGNLHSNVKRGNVYIEFHRSMVDSCHETLSAYYGDGFRLPHKSEGSEYEYKLTDEDFYVFLVAHIAKHYRYGGTGIRSLLDLYIYEKSLPSLDFDYINGELEKIGLLVFYNKIRKITYDWYSGGFDGEFDIMSEYIVSGGVYGIEDTSMQNSFILDNID